LHDKIFSGSGCPDATKSTLTTCAYGGCDMIVLRVFFEDLKVEAVHQGKEALFRN